MTNRPIGRDDGRIPIIFDAHEPDLLAAVREVQRTLGPFPSPEIDTALPIFDFCDIPRHAVFRQILDRQKKAIIARIRSADFTVEQFKSLIHPTLRYLSVPMLKEIPLTLMDRFPNVIDTGVLDALKNDPQLFDNCTMSIRRRVWMNDPSFFRDCIYSMTMHYIQEEPIQYNSHIIRPEDNGRLLLYRRDYPTFKLFTDIADQEDPQMYFLLMNTLQDIFEEAPHSELPSLKFDLIMYYHKKGIKVADFDPCFQVAKVYEDMLQRNDPISDLSIYERIEQAYQIAEDNNASKAANFLLLEPTANHYLAKRIVEWLRKSVEDDADDELLGNAAYGCSRVMNHAEEILKKPFQQFPPPDESSTFWHEVCKIIIKEEIAGASAHDAAYIEKCLTNHEVARKIFAQYIIDRLYQADMHTLSRLLPCILNTLPMSSDPTEQHVNTYECLIRTIIRYLLKKKLLVVMFDPWKGVVMDNFLMQVVRWNSRIHIAVVRMLQEYFKNERLLHQAGPNINVVSDWIATVFINGAKSQEDIPAFHHIYASILTASDTACQGQYAIRPPVVMEFLANLPR